MPLLKDKTLYCVRRGPVTVVSEDEKKKVFQVRHAGKLYAQSYADVGRILFFSEEDAGRPPEDLALHAEYYPFLKKDPRFRAAWTARKKERELLRRAKAEPSVLPAAEEGEEEDAAAAELIRRPPSMEKKDLLAYLDDRGQLKAERERLAAVERLIASAVSRAEREEKEVDRQLGKLQRSSDNAGNAELYAEIRRNLTRRAGELAELADHPYFARMDYLNEEGKLERVYLGKRESADLDVISWRSPVAERYYIKSENTFSVNGYLYDLVLRRAFRIKSREMTALRNEYLDLTKVLGEEAAEYGISALADPFLQDILKERKTLTGFSDIVETIQEEQYRIIRSDRTRDLMVQGCAGSGKTMIMLHRISYLVYNFREIAPENYLILAPSDSFNVFIRDMAESLQLQRIERKKVSGYYLRTVTSAGFLRDKIELNKLKSIPYLQYLYSEEAVRDARTECGRFAEELKAAFVGPRLEAIQEAAAQNRRMGELFAQISARLEETPVRQSYAKPVVRFLDLIGKMRDQATYSRQVFEDLEGFAFGEDERAPVERTAMLRRFFRQCRLIVRRDFNYEEKLFSYPLFPSETLSESEASAFFEALNELTRRWKQGIMRENLQIYTLRQHIEKCRTRRETLPEGDVEIGVLTRSEAEDEQKIAGISRSLADWEAGAAEAEKLTGEARRAFGEPERLAAVLKKIRDFCLDRAPEPEIAALGGKLWDFLPRFSRQEALSEQKRELKEWVEAYLEAYRRRDQALARVLEGEPKEAEEDLWSLTVFLLCGLFARKRAEYGEPPAERVSVKELPLLLWALHFYGFRPKKQFDYLFIDEAQDLSVMEFELLRALNPGCRINCFGDINQNISPFKGLESSEAGFFRDFVRFDLRQNYRNTNEIVEYCNRVCGLNMIPIGVEGADVQEFSEGEAALRQLLTERGTKAVVAADPGKVRRQLEAILPARRINLLGPQNPINYKKINLMDVEECKGLEFTAVAVFSEGLSEREFYIACTRALDRLIVVSSGQTSFSAGGGK